MSTSLKYILAPGKHPFGRGKVFGQMYTAISSSELKSFTRSKTTEVLSLTAHVVETLVLLEMMIPEKLRL